MLKSHVFKLLSLALVVMMVFAVGVTAFADTADSAEAPAQELIATEETTEAEEDVADDGSLKMGWLSVVPVLLAIVGAIATKKPFESLLVGSVVGCIMAYKGNFLTEWVLLLQNTAAENIWIFLVCGLFGGLIALLTKAKGTAGFYTIGNKICKSQRTTLLVTWILGVIIFVDDYLNMLTVGACMRSICDEKKIPREALAYLLDSTGTPVCMMLPFSTWAAFYMALFMEQPAVAAIYGEGGGMSMFIKLIPLNFYAWITVLFVFLFAMGIMPKFGKMKTAYKRAMEQNQPFDPTPANLEKNKGDDVKNEHGNVWDFLIPMIVLIFVTFDPFKLGWDILLGVCLALASCLILYVPRKIMSVTDWSDTMIHGFCDIVPTIAALLAAFMVANVSGAMGLTNFVITTVKSFPLPQLYPIIVFLVMAFITFATGSIWGSSTVVVPFIIPLASAMGASIPLTIAAVMSGGTFGSHACFFADATMLAAESSKIEVMDHNLSQLPYVIITSILTIIGLGVCGCLGVGL
ncbi:MAG: Na+/H+ antiporter NhaC family protein [Clostridia bacterium]|nr:Na+/H+ antiporter NhaC family protein [Clostridia bacterium]